MYNVYNDSKWNANIHRKDFFHGISCLVFFRCTLKIIPPSVLLFFINLFSYILCFLSMGDSKNSYHPALTVNNIKTSILVVLELDNSQYSTWAELFKIHARSHRVLDHIIPPVSKGKGTKKAPLNDEEKEWWSILDAAVVG